MQANVRTDADAKKLGLGGAARCDITRDNKLTLLLPGQSAVRKEHSWPLAYLRRYGREAGVFYFEAGRRCASGEVTVYFAAQDVDKLYATVDEAVQKFKSEAEAKEKELADALKREKEAKEEKEKQQEEELRKSMAKHSVSAEVEAKRQMAEAEANEEDKFKTGGDGAAAQARRPN